MNTSILKTRPEEAGRKGDKFIGHLTPGEIVIPRAIASDDDFRAIIAQFFRDNNIDPERFIVGSGKNKVNPETGYLEFGFSLKKLNPFRRGSYFRQWFDPALETLLILPKKLKEVAMPPPPKLPPQPPKPDPIPQPIPGREERAAKRRVRRRARRSGRDSTILAGRMFAQRRNTSILKTRLGNYKGTLG